MEWFNLEIWIYRYRFVRSISISIVVFITIIAGDVAARVVSKNKVDGLLYANVIRLVASICEGGARSDSTAIATSSYDQAWNANFGLCFCLRLLLIFLQ